MKKLFFLPGIFLCFGLLITGCASTKSNIEHPVTIQMDLSKYVRNISFSKKMDSDIYSYTIQNLKLKNIPLSGDTLSLYINAKSDVNIPEMDCEILNEEQSLAKIKLINTTEKKSFISDSNIVAASDFPPSVSIKLSFKDNSYSKKPWLQLQTAKMPEIEKNTSDSKAVNSKENSVTEKTENKSSSDAKQTTASTKSKKTSKTDLPEDVQNLINNTQETTSSWFICKVKSGKKAGDLYSGPFETKEQAIVVWIYKNLKEKKRYCIAKNYTYITDSPSSYFGDTYDYIYDEIQDSSFDEVFQKYFFSVEDKAESVLTEEQPVEVKETETAAVTAPVFELPLINSDNDLFSKYQKEYLQDYAPKKQFTLPSETIKERTIEKPNEADAFGCTLLMKAARNGNNWEIKSLLSSGADVNLTDKDGWTALMYACRYQENISIVESLINAGAQIKVKNNFNLSALILAASYNGNPEIVRKLLTYYSVSEKEVLQAFVLLLSDNGASDFSKLAKIDTFLEKSIPLNTFYNGKTPLMYAAQYSESTNILQRLLDAGAITAVRSTEGKTAFDYAQENIKLKHDDTYWSLNKK